MAASLDRSLVERQVAESQRTDAHYYRVARLGYDVTTGETDKGALQRWAAKRSKATRDRLFSLIGNNQKD